MIISIDTEKAPYKIQHSFMIKRTLNKFGIEGKQINTINYKHSIPTGNIPLKN